MTHAARTMIASLVIALTCGLSFAADAQPAAKLVITKAVYGDLPGGASTDVTKKVADMVKDDILSVDATNDNFGDPVEGTGKKLRVEFTIGGKADSRTVDENQTLTLTTCMAPTPKLAITKAVYGDLPSGPSTDVTKKVAEMVKDNALTVEATNDNFGDPAEGTGKKLKVDYTLGSKADNKTVDEGQSLQITATAPIAGGKLVIIKAWYGDLPSGPSTDVTKKVAEMVKNNALTAEASNDNFGDPAEGTGKKLRVIYSVGGDPDTKTVNEGETLTVTGPAAAVAGKLVITKAVYGDLPSGASTDVTAKVAEMVKDNALSVGATNDNFGDPAEGTGKKLKVDYTIGDKADSKTVDENETLTITAPAPAAAATSAATNGLAIVKAVYGDIPNGNSTDVTAKVAGMVKDNALSVEATNDNFGDPAEGVGKKLKVDYTFKGTAKTKTVDENETLSISSSGE